jgi:hypothetical protein
MPINSAEGTNGDGKRIRRVGLGVLRVGIVVVGHMEDYEITGGLN